MYVSCNPKNYEYIILFHINWIICYIFNYKCPKLLDKLLNRNNYFTISIKIFNLGIIQNFIFQNQ